VGAGGISARSRTNGYQISAPTLTLWVFAPGRSSNASFRGRGPGVMAGQRMDLPVTVPAEKLIMEGSYRMRPRPETILDGSLVVIGLLIAGGRGSPALMEMMERKTRLYSTPGWAGLS
jgi:hypothetical protein